VVRLFLSIVAAGAAAVQPVPDTDEVYEHYIGQAQISEGVSGYLLGPWQRWDALWYTKIAHFGYDPDDGSTNLFPLYPLMMRGVGQFLGDRFLLAGIIVSNLAFIGGLIYFYRLGEYEIGEAAARRAVTYLAFFPTAFFLLAPYTESLLLLCIIAAFYYARRRSWRQAGLFGLGGWSHKDAGSPDCNPVACGVLAVVEGKGNYGVTVASFWRSHRPSVH